MFRESEEGGKLENYERRHQNEPDAKSTGETDHKTLARNGNGSGKVW